MKYYIVSLSGGSTYVCNDLQEMINWFRYHTHQSWYDKYPTNGAFSRVSMNPNDTYVSYQCWVDEEGRQRTKRYYERRDIMVIDQENRVIDPRLYHKEILADPPRRKKFLWDFKHGGKLPVYRQDPIPHTSLRRYRVRMYKRPHYMNEVRRSQEHPEYNRGERGVTTYPWDSWDYDRHPRVNERSWKQKKIKKQWMKNLR